MSKSTQIYVIAALCLLVFNTSCYFSQKEKTAIDVAESLLETNPDSTLSLLDSVYIPEDLGDEYLHKHRLLKIQAKDKLNLNIMDGSAIVQTKEYYKSIGNKELYSRSAFYEGRVFHEAGNTMRATQAYTEAANAAKQTDNYYLNGQIHTFLGVLYKKECLAGKAIENYKIAEEYFKRINDNKNIISNYRRIADAFLIANEIDSSYFYYNKSLEMAIQENDKDLEAGILQNLGVAALHNQEYQKTRNYVRKSMQLRDGNRREAMANVTIAQSFAGENRRDSALYYVEQAASFDPNNKNAALQAQITKTLSMIEEGSGNLKKAITHKDGYIDYLDKRLDAKNNHFMAELEKRYNYEQTRIENARLQISEHRSTIFILCLVFGVIVLIGLLVWLFFKRKQEKLEAEKNIAELQNLANTYNEENKSIRDIILDHFNIFKKTALMEKFLHEEDRKKNQKLLTKFNETVYGKDSFDWDKTYRSMDILYDGFCRKLRARYPELDKSEFHICCLTYADLDNKDISIITGYKVNSIQTKKYNIRKKMGIDGYGSIVLHLNQVLFGRDTTEQTGSIDDLKNI